MQICVACGVEAATVHETEGADITYCQSCGHEETHKLERIRSLRRIETEPSMWRQKQKESHPARKGFRRSKQGQ